VRLRKAVKNLLPVGRGETSADDETNIRKYRRDGRNTGFDESRKADA
jgi:hypothetical protein